MAYIFGGSTGETAESIKRKRAWVQAMLESATSGGSSTVGEGISKIGRALAGRVGQAVLDKREREGTAAAMKAAGGNSYIRDLLLGNTGGGAEISGTGGANVAPGSGGGDYFANIRSAESGGNDAAKNPKSSATGRYQFIKSTWDELARKRPELGLTPDGRTDPGQNERAIRAFTADNAKVLASAGIEPTGGNLYAAHFLGAGGARSVLTQPDNASVAAIVGPGVVKANPFLARMTVGDFKRWTASKGGDNTLAGGEANDTLQPQVPPAAGYRGHGINTMTGGPSSITQVPPDQATLNPLPPDRLMPSGPVRPSLPPMQPQMAQGMPQQAMNTPAAAPPPNTMTPDPMRTAAIPQPMMRPRGIVSPRAEDNGYVSGPGAAMQQPGGQGGGLLARLLMRQPMPQPAQGQPMSGTGGTATAPGGTGNDEMMQMYQLLDSGLLPESYRAAILDEIKRRRDRGDPAYQLDMDLKRAQLEKARAPEPAPDTYRTLSAEEKQKLGLDPAQSYQVDGANKISQIGGGGVNVNVGEVKVPAGYRPLDPNNPGAGVEPIPGGSAEVVPAETAARFGMAKGFIENYDAIEKQVKAGALTGLWDQGQAEMGWGKPGELTRQIQSGMDGLQRMLTGAGMPQSEAAAYASRYLPGVFDTAESAASKLKQLKEDILKAGEMVGKGRGGNPIATPNSGNEDPLGIR